MKKATAQLSKEVIKRFAEGLSDALIYRRVQWRMSFYFTILRSESLDFQATVDQNQRTRCGFAAVGVVFIY